MKEKRQPKYYVVLDESGRFGLATSKKVLDAFLKTASPGTYRIRHMAASYYRSVGLWDYPTFWTLTEGTERVVTI